MCIRLPTIYNTNQFQGVALKRAVVQVPRVIDLLAAGVLSDGLGSLAHSVLGQLTGQEETDGSLNLPGREGGTSVVVCQARGLGGDALENVIHERVHDRHSLAADAGVGVHLLQHLVDVDRVALPPPLPALLVSTALGLRLRGGLLRSFTSCCFGWHVCCLLTEWWWQCAAEPFILRAEPFLQLKRAAAVVWGRGVQSTQTARCVFSA